jgi:3-methyladenine DNA glycosylase AlkC
MVSVQTIIRRVQKTTHGFLDIQAAADEIITSYSAKENFNLAGQLFASEIFQLRSLATFMLGRLAANSEASLAFLKLQVSRDPDWRVQEILAKAFDRYCADRGYANVLPVIEEWLADHSANVRRSVSEGLRIWTGRPYFSDHPETAIRLLSRLRDDESIYVRKSAGNALRDISKRHPQLIKNELECWDLSSKRIAFTYKLANKFLENNSRVNRQKSGE